MRILPKLALLAVLAAPVFPALYAQAPAAAPATCAGVIATVRVSEITPGGSLEKFNAAVAAHLAWYRAHGVKNNQIVVGRLYGPGSTTYTDKQVMTFHINPPQVQPKHDADYDAFIKLYSDTSKLVITYTTCLPETVFSADPVPWMKM